MENSIAVPIKCQLTKDVLIGEFYSTLGWGRIVLGLVWGLHLMVFTLPVLGEPYTVPGIKPKLPATCQASAFPLVPSFWSHNTILYVCGCESIFTLVFESHLTGIRGPYVMLAIELGLAIYKISTLLLLGKIFAAQNVVE